MDKHTAHIDTKIVIDPKGPYTVYGKLNILEYFIINGNDGKALRYDQGDKNYSMGEVTHLCRCGVSKKKPYCDGSHLKTDCGSELTALEDKFMNGVKMYEGPYYTLYDKESLCSAARFCDAKEGAWNLIMSPQSQDDIDLSVHVSQMCPAGRLVVQERTSGKILESHMERAIGLIEDTPLGLSGPIWVIDRKSVV